MAPAQVAQPLFELVVVGKLSLLAHRHSRFSQIAIFDSLIAILRRGEA